MQSIAVLKIIRDEKETTENDVGKQMHFLPK